MSDRGIWAGDTQLFDFLEYCVFQYFGNFFLKYATVDLLLSLSPPACSYKELDLKCSWRLAFSFASHIPFSPCILAPNNPSTDVIHYVGEIFPLSYRHKWISCCHGEITWYECEIFESNAVIVHRPMCQMGDEGVIQALTVGYSNT